MPFRNSNVALITMGNCEKDVIDLLQPCHQQAVDYILGAFRSSSPHFPRSITLCPKYVGPETCRDRHRPSASPPRLQLCGCRKASSRTSTPVTKTTAAACLMDSSSCTTTRAVPCVAASAVAGLGMEACAHCFPMSLTGKSVAPKNRHLKVAHGCQ